MCGIVGYVGPRDAAPILLEGLRRLEYRGYDSAGIAVLTEPGEVFVEKKAGKLSNLTDHLNGGGSGRASGHRPHPLGDPRPPQRRQRPSAYATAAASLALIHNGIIENYARDQGAAAGRRPSVHLGDRYRGAGAPDRGALRRRPGGGGARALQRRARRLRHRRHAPRSPRSDRRGTHERAPDRGARDAARVSWRATCRPSWSTPRTSSSSQEGDIADVTARGGHHRRLDGVRGRARGHADPLEHRGRGEGRLPAFHPQGDLRAAARHRGGPARPRGRRGQRDAARAGRDRGGAAAVGAGLRGRLWHGALRGRGRGAPHPELGGAAGDRPDRLRDALLAAARSTTGPSSSASASRARRRTRWRRRSWPPSAAP